MMLDWSPLQSELALWRSSHLPLEIWWRDDDAIAVTAALDQLCALAEDLGARAHLAIIPALAQDSLAAVVSWPAPCRAMVHGWAHQNHNPPDQKKAEFGAPRAGVSDDMQRGIDTLQMRLGPQVLPVFVPPWNRMDLTLARHLPGFGYRGLSAFGPRIQTHAAPGVINLNTHIDPIDWRGTRGLVAPDTLIARVVSILQDRRAGRVDATEPLGYLTHHLIHDDPVWDFSRALLSELLAGGAQHADIDALLKDTP